MDPVASQTNPQWYIIFTYGTMNFGKIHSSLVLNLGRGINLYISATHSVSLPPMTRVTCMCLYVVLLVNISLYWLLCMVKNNVCCKTLCYCTREAKMSQKYLFVMLKRNELVISYFLPCI